MAIGKSCRMIAFGLAATALSMTPAFAWAADKPIPQFVQKNGKHTLMVDGAPFLILGGQANNSSNYPGMLDKVWPAIRDVNANTLVIPVAWEQVEPAEGRFDFSYVDTLIKEARANNVRLGLLWFGTWKNTGPSYTPPWVKLDNKRFPRLTNKDGSLSYALSPHYKSTLDADKRAYTALMNHIKAIDSADRTVIITQVENEVGVYGTERDYSPVANKLFAQAVPPALIKQMGDRALKKSGTWSEVFGKHADEYFHAWYMATFCNDVAAAGKAAYALPAYVNAALKDPLNPEQAAGSYASGGPTYNVIDIYKVAAPQIDFLAPDLYSPGSKSYEATLKWYKRPDNALYVAESGNTPTYARFIFSVLGQQGIGFDPFGFDYTGYSNYPLGSIATDRKIIEPFAPLYKLFGGMSRVWARLSFEGQVWGVSEPDDHSAQTLDLGSRWNAKVTYRQWQFGMPEWDPQNKNGFPEGSDVPSGGVAVARLSDNEFLVAGHNARISFGSGPANKDKGMLLDRVEEGHYDATGQWVMQRVWNGDQTDYGLNFKDQPRLLKVRLGTYEKK